MKLAGSKTPKYPTQPLLESKKKASIPKNPPYLFSNEPPEKKRKRIVKVKQENVIEAKTSGNTSASEAEVPEAKSSKDKKATETAATEDVKTSDNKESEQDKGIEATASEVKPTAEKDKGKTVKKPRTVKKRATRVQRKMVISYSEETEEEPLFKRKRT
ncbi:hypothetical protein A2U01_0017482 [Trifolium medium]|uniref:Uncharacterized protein n=1 Tax=Trifolium medium TaxID=97028 RepID=A0A392NBJ0_9FABA|nr:hypothetical protein [Trifolium medium]